MKLTPTIFAILFFASSAYADIDDTYSNRGGTLYSHFLWGSYDSLQNKANQYCSSIGKAQPNIVRKSTGCLVFCDSEYHGYDFTCTDVKNTQTEQPTDSVKSNTAEPVHAMQSLSVPDAQLKMTINDAKLKCEDLGFKPKTEKFGDCVLELTK